ncbi:GGDEF domain-containing protein [Paenibacillus piri]|uniref:GGDEF domain-containing protein n=1 Tax=Paenibacillus piri TaxID=2547395 RepID=A0A4R5KK04_9BACL|nr:GGDEF domain-containing protein [Paenibacillus piri]TDF95889.1 GGDEF domain-containing protein [Paenibacillus piri]
MNDLRLEDLGSGTLGAIISYTIILVILLLTLLVAFRLLMTRRKIGYLSITVSLMILMAQYGQLVYFQLNPDISDTAAFWAMMLKVFSFLLVNTGIYQLYNPTRLRDGVVFVVCCAVTAVISLSYWYIPGWLEGNGSQIKLLQPLIVELFLVVLLFISFLLVNSRIGQNVKYQLMLTLYFCTQMIHMANIYVFGGNQPVLMKLEQTIPMLFHLILFLFIVERVIELMQAIYNSSIRDGLTQLYNRKYFYNRVGQYIAGRISVSVIFSDIDNFKKLNDTKGHHMGDQVLKQVAGIMREETDQIGICGRYGGEEMVVLVTDPDTDSAELAERIRARIEAETIVTVSMGWSRHKKQMTADELIKQADEAMYKAKTSGKNKVVAS